ncbi:MAG: DUF6089 family protein, partial [Saprospiraceae bacterium]
MLSLRRFFAITVCVFGFGPANMLMAQFAEQKPTLEIGLLAAATNYSGDLADDHVIFAQTQFGAGAFARLHLNKLLQIRGQFFAGSIGGDDKRFPTLASRQFRFETKLLEGAALLEATIATFEYEPVSTDVTFYFHPYIFGGVGITSADAKVTYYGPESDRPRIVVEPLPEGGTSKRTFVSTPIGLGLRMVAGRISLGLEVCSRPVFDDLLDGVSKNGNPNKGDWYHSLNLMVSYSL